MGEGEGSPQGRIKHDDSLKKQGLGFRHNGKAVIPGVGGGSGQEGHREMEEPALASLGRKREPKASLLR